jgi:hypothetical protein
MKDFSPPIEADLVQVSETVFAAPGSGVVNADRMPVVFSALPDGTGACTSACGPRQRSRKRGAARRQQHRDPPT